MAEASAPQATSNVTDLSSDLHRLNLRMLEAILFATREPLSDKQIGARLPDGINVRSLLLELQTAYAGRGVNLQVSDGAWAFRTAEDLSFVLQSDVVEHRRLSRAALETLAIIAYHQPVTRAEIEEVRGVAVAKGTLDVLLQTEWVRLRGRRNTPGRPVTFGTTPQFLDHFGLAAIRDLPGLAELRASGLLENGETEPSHEAEPDEAERIDPELAPNGHEFDEALASDWALEDDSRP